MFTGVSRVWFLWAFAFLGPLGNLLTPGFLPEQFRVYYFLLPLFPFLFTTFSRPQLNLFLIFLPFFLYCFISVLYVQIYGSHSLQFPIERFFLLLVHFLFALGIASLVEDEEKLISIYLKAFFASLVVGYLFYVGYYLHLISFEFIERFSVLAQIGYGFLRFSPGSYPNEYGIVSSFVLSILTYILIKKESLFSTKFLFIFFGLALGALMLATTRAAYISFLFCLIYMTWREKCFLPIFKWVLAVSMSIIGILWFFGIDMLKILYFGFALEAFQSGSMEVRVSYWVREWEAFLESPLFGKGFASVADLHNVYLQVLFELGIVGTVLLAATVLVVMLSASSYPLGIRLRKEKNLLSMVKTFGWIHVVWFAASNSNLNHHLTWFVVLLCFSSLVYRKKREIVQDSFVK